MPVRKNRSALICIGVLGALCCGDARAGYDVRIESLRIQFRSSDDRPVPEAYFHTYVGTFSGGMEVPLFVADSPADPAGEINLPRVFLRSERETLGGTALRMRFVGLIAPTCDASPESCVVALPPAMLPRWDDPAPAGPGFEGPPCSISAGARDQDRLERSVRALVCRFWASRAELDRLVSAGPLDRASLPGRGAGGEP